MSANQAPIIIKKIKKGGGHGHHGGAWKVAYADFVTAMMAFFLLMWLLNATSEEQKRGISNYFGPYGTSQGAGGSGGVLGGLSVQSKGMWTDNKTSPTVVSPTNKLEETEETDIGDEIGGELEEDAPAAQKGPPNAAESAALAKEKASDAEKNAGEAENQKEEAKKQVDRKKAKETLEAIEDLEVKSFKEAEESLRQAMEAIPELKELTKNLIIDNTPEGMRIQIVDQNGLSMFPLGSSQMYEHMKRLLEQVAKVTVNLSNKISISGHTDAKPYANANNYSNWELSSDRANASRRILLDAGLSQERIYSVVGKAATEPLVATDPESERNRRISIVLRKKNLDDLKEGLEDQNKPRATPPAQSPASAKESASSRAPTDQEKIAPLQEDSKASPSQKTPLEKAPEQPLSSPKEPPPSETQKKIISSVDAMLGKQLRP